MFISAVGLYDVEYQVSVAARDSCIYTIKGGGRTPKYRFSLGSQPCGMQRIDKDLVIGCMDQTLSCFSVKVRSGGWGQGEGPRSGSWGMVVKLVIKISKVNFFLPCIINFFVIRASVCGRTSCRQLSLWWR